ncbi:Bucentaur [Aphelenchoides besseyi]|nr:Bucentaur [Aphelenchoides besseyi]KAI6207931.1 Bucentaur [Aphelenchoides besseyi]
MDTNQYDDYQSDEDEDYVIPDNAPPEDENEVYRIKADEETKEQKLTKNADDLWAEFLGETNTDTSQQSTDSPSTSNEQRDPTTSVEKTETSNDDTKRKSVETTDDLFDKLKEEKSENVNNNSVDSFTLAKDPKNESDNLTKNPQATATKRPWTRTAKSSGLDSAISFIKRSKKGSVLDKTKKDWDKFVTDKSIKEELESHNRSQNSYLDQQNFLATADLKKFEKEKETRDLARKKH